ncbi:MAG TPA: high-potential iron-sulfur protein [Rhodocyclaceae bacterium]
MQGKFKSDRRQMLKIGGLALAAIPVLALTGKANAATNAAMRGSMKYQEKPGPDGKECGKCMQYVPGKPLGGCKLFPGDTEISPTGYCVAWAAAQK